MNEATQAVEEHLRAIRARMEQAAVHRSLSVGTAAVGGVLSLAAAAWGALGGPKDITQFAVAWLLVLAGTIGSDAWRQRREARAAGLPGFPSRWRLAWRAASPSLLAGGLLAAIVMLHVDTLPDGALAATIGSVWCVFYGLALLSAQTFSPPSVARLGWAFLLAGLLLPAGLATADLLDAAPAWNWETTRVVGHVGLGVTFGLFHLAYAALEGRREPKPDTAALDARP